MHEKLAAAGEQEPDLVDRTMTTCAGDGGRKKIEARSAPGPGTLRKWSFAMLELHESKDAWLVNHWNIAAGFTHALRRTLFDLADGPEKGG